MYTLERIHKRYIPLTSRVDTFQPVQTSKFWRLGFQILLNLGAIGFDLLVAVLAFEDGCGEKQELGVAPLGMALGFMILYQPQLSRRYPLG